MPTPQTTVTSNKAWAPDVQAFPVEDAVPEALVLKASTVAGNVEGDAVALICPYVVDAPVSFTPEGIAPAISEPTLAGCTVFTAKLSQVVAVSREQLDQNRASELLTHSMSRALVTAADNAFIAQVAPTAPAVSPPPGLLNIPGITAGGAINGSLDKLTDVLAGMQATGGAPSVILASPTAWANLSKIRSAAGSNTTLLGAGVQAGELMLAGIPVIVTAALATNKLLVVDRGAVISAVGPVLLAQSTDAFFAADVVALRATWRIGWNVVRPDRIASMTVTAPTA